MLNSLSYFILRIVGRFKNGGVVINNHTDNRKQIRMQVETLGRYFDFIHHDELLSRLTQRKSKPFCLFTFDDGKKINATETAPEMERLGVPGVFFVATEFLYHKTPLWFDVHESIEKKLGILPANLELSAVKQLPFAELKERIEKASEKYSVTVDMSNPCIAPMSWDDARTLKKKGFTIGAHTTWHCILTNEPINEALTDIKHSINTVTKEIGSPCQSFAFANGNYTPYLAQYAIDCGVKTAMTTEPAWANETFPAWKLPRIQMYDYYSKKHVTLKILAAMSNFLLKNPDGTGRSYVYKSV